MSTLLDWLTPWWAKLAALAAVLFGLWFVVHSYNVAVSKKAVVEALKAERAVTKPKIEALRTELATIKATSEAEALRQKAVVDLKTKEYQNALAKNKTLKVELDSKRSSDADFERLLNTLSANNNASTASAGARYDRIKTAHQQCERDLREALSTTAGTIAGLGEALAGIEALGR
jgi:predicted RNase H-like nuclease (RuvC/YqgF family)